MPSNEILPLYTLMPLVKELQKLPIEPTISFQQAVVTVRHLVAPHTHQHAMQLHHLLNALKDTHRLSFDSIRTFYLQLMRHEANMRVQLLLSETWQQRLFGRTTSNHSELREEIRGLLWNSSSRTHTPMSQAPTSPAPGAPPTGPQQARTTRPTLQPWRARGPALHEPGQMEASSAETPLSSPNRQPSTGSQPAVLSKSSLAHEATHSRSTRSLASVQAIPLTSVQAIPPSAPPTPVASTLRPREQWDSFNQGTRSAPPSSDDNTKSAVRQMFKDLYKTPLPRFATPAPATTPEASCTPSQANMACPSSNGLPACPDPLDIDSTQEARLVTQPSSSSCTELPAAPPKSSPFVAVVHTANKSTGRS